MLINHTLIAKHKKSIMLVKIRELLLPLFTLSSIIFQVVPLKSIELSLQENPI